MYHFQQANYSIVANCDYFDTLDNKFELMAIQAITIKGKVKNCYHIYEYTTQV